MPSLDALQNAARLKASPSRANMANYDDVFAGPAEGHVPSAFEQAGAERVRTDAATALGAGPAFAGLQRAQEASRIGGINDEIDTEANLGTGRPQRIAGMRAEMGNDIADVNSERGAARSFLPYATDARNRDVEEANTVNETRYLAPAQYKAEGDVEAAHVAAGGRVNAAKANHEGDALKGLFNAINTLMGKTGKPPTPEDVAALKQHFGIR